MEYKVQLALEILIANYNQLRDDFKKHVNDKNVHKTETEFDYQ